MMRRLFTLLLTSLLGWAGAAQAQATIDYPDAIRMIRVDGTKIMLINRADGPDGIRYFLYSEPGSNFGCVGPGFASSTATNKPQSMNALSVTLDKIFAKWINQLNRTAVLFDERGDSYHVQLPTVQELAALREKHGGLPANWRDVCKFNSEPRIQKRSEFWTANPNWNEHSTYSLETGKETYRWDTDEWAVALKVRIIDPNEVCLFKDGAFDSTVRCYSAGDHRWLDDMNDKASSIILGKNCSARLYEHGDFGGRSLIYNERRKASEAWGWLNSLNDQVSSMKVRCGEQSVVGDSEVCLFEHGDMRGNVACYGKGDVRFVDKYPDGAAANDTFSSLVVGKNCSVTLFEHGDYFGMAVNYSAISAGKNVKVNWFQELNDQTSSLQVRCR